VQYVQDRWEGLRTRMKASSVRSLLGRTLRFPALGRLFTLRRKKHLGLIIYHSNPGEFQAIITIRNLKINATFDAEKSLENQTLVFNITSPQKQRTLPFSAAHRLLTIRIRRGVFQHGQFEDLSIIPDRFKGHILGVPMPGT
jgi:hypothetical protein